MTQFRGNSYSPPSGFYFDSVSSGDGHLVYGPDGRMWAAGSVAGTGQPYLVAFDTSFNATFYAIGPTNSGVGQDCCTDGTYMYLVTFDTPYTVTVYQVTTAGSATSIASFSCNATGGYAAVPWSCVFDGTYIWIYGESNKPVVRFYRVTTGGTVTTFSPTGSGFGGTGGHLSLFNGAFWIGTTAGVTAPGGVLTVNYPSPSAVTAYTASPLNNAWAGLAYDGTNLWVADGTTVTPNAVVSINPSTGAGTATGTPSGNSIPLTYDGSLVWGAVVANGAFSFSPGSPGTYTTYTSYYVSGVSTSWYGGSLLGLDGANNLWVACANGSPVRYQIATNGTPVVTTQLVMLV